MNTDYSTVSDDVLCENDEFDFAMCHGSYFYCRYCPPICPIGR